MLLVVGERETLDQDLVHFEAMHHLKSVEVPHDDVSLTKSNSESGVSINLNLFSVTVITDRGS